MAPDGELRPRVALARVVEVLGPTLLDVLSVPAEGARDIFDVAIHDASDELVAGPGDLVLGVGVHPGPELGELVARLDQRGAAGLVVKVPPPGDGEGSGSPPGSSDGSEARTVGHLPGGVAVLGVTRGASWAQVASLVRSLLAPGGHPRDLAGAPADDLFSLADAVTALLDAPVTIEDNSSRVLAFSGRQDEADTGRRETILGRRVPTTYRRLLEERGVFRQLARDGGPVYVDCLTDETLPRVAVSVRAGDEVLGSMWAAVSGPLSTERQQAFVDAAKVVALHLLRLRAGADVAGRLQADLLATLLEGGERAGEAASRLGIGADHLCVLAAQLLAAQPLAAQPLAGEPAHLEAGRQRLTQALAVHFTAVRPRSAVALVGGVAYVVTALDARDADGTSVLRLAEEFVERVGRRDDVLIGIGRPTRFLAEVVRSRVDADRALRVLELHRPPGGPGRRVARFADVQVESLLLRLSDLVADDGELLLGPLGELVDYDARHRSGLVETVLAWLEAFGDIPQAAAAVHVHPNTFRYRLRRVGEVSGLDLADPQVRLGVMLQLRLRELAGAG